MKWQQDVHPAIQVKERPMSWRCAILTALVLTAVRPLSAQNPEYRLRWQNGDELAGRIVSATSDQLVWSSPMLSQDVTLNLSVLDSMTAVADDRPQVDAAQSPFRVILAGDMALVGELASVTPTHVEIDSQRMGRVMLDRLWIQSVQRSGSGGVIDLVGTRGAGWKSVDPQWVDRQPHLKDWNHSKPDRVIAEAAGARLYLPTDLPSCCDIELKVENRSHRPAFSLAFGALEHLQNRKGNLEVETWFDDLVISSTAADGSTVFEQLGQLDDDARSVTLRIFWNRSSGQVSVYDRSGKQLAEARMALALDITSGGVLLENKGAELTVTRLRVNAWDGEQSPQIVQEKSRLRTKAGREYYGTLSGPDDGGNFSIRAGDDVAHVAVDEVIEIEFADAPADVAADEPDCLLSFGDGTLVRGDLLRIVNDQVILQTRFAQAPVTCRLAGLKHCQFQRAAVRSSIESRHILDYAGLQLHGTLAPAETALGWRLVGSETSIPLNLDEPLSIRRIEDGEDGPKFTDVDRDIVLLKSGDRLPCRVETIDERFVVIATDFSDLARIPRNEVQAVSFDTQQLKPFNGFGDRRWRLNGKVPTQLERKEESIVFHDTASVSHPTVLSAGTLEFDVDWNRAGQSYLMITLMPQHPLQQMGRMEAIVAARSRHMFYLMFNQSRVNAHILQGNALQAVNQRQDVDAAGPIHVALRRRNGEVTLLINDQEQGAVHIPDEQLTSLGVTFQTQPFRNTNGQRGGDLKLIISSLKVTRGNGLFFHLPILKTAKEHIVTVPRMRRDRPPSHVLVGANGDLLRGRLVSLGRSSARFESRLQDVTIPRDHLSGIVWLQEPDDGADEEAPEEGGGEQARQEPDPPTVSSGAVQVTLGNGVVMTVLPERADGNELVARHHVFGRCQFKLTSIAHLRASSEPRHSALTDESPLDTEWTLIHAPEPVIPGANDGFGTYSELVGQPAEDFSLPLLNGGDFRLSEHRGKIMVLDFWATWCGPCIQAMPQLMAAVGEFPDDVELVAINQGESTQVITAFLEAREWTPTVALDSRGDVARQFRVQGIPQTVIVGRDGEIMHVHLGSSPDLHASLRAVLEHLVNESPEASSE
jgi:thiol-disulfide isomerase/thioredoxin